MLWDPQTQNVIEDSAPGGAAQESHTHEIGMDELLVSQRATGRRILLVDALKSVRGVVDEVGTKVNSYAYHAFGFARVQVEGTPNRFRFSGREWDAETGTQYNRWRNYDPSAGRWTQPDPLGLAAGPNVYGYVNNNPTSLIDPTGMNPGALVFVPGVGQVLVAGGLAIVVTTGAVLVAKDTCENLTTPWRDCESELQECRIRHEQDVVFVTQKRDPCGNLINVEDVRKVLSAADEAKCQAEYQFCKWATRVRKALHYNPVVRMVCWLAFGLTSVPPPD